MFPQVLPYGGGTQQFVIDTSAGTRGMVLGRVLWWPCVDTPHKAVLVWDHVLIMCVYQWEDIQPESEC